MKRGNSEIAMTVARCLSSNPNDRYATFGQLVAAWDKGIRTTWSPSPSTWRRDERIELAGCGPADTAWSGVCFPERIPESHVLVNWDISAASGVAEARDFYRLDRHAEAVSAAEKTLGRSDEPISNFQMLLRGELLENSSLRKVDLASDLRSAIVPSRSMAIEALVWSMRALVALVEAHPEDPRWIRRLIETARSVQGSKLRDHEVLILASQGYLLGGDFATALEIARSVRRADPLAMLAGWVEFQALRRSGDLVGAVACANDLIEQCIVQGRPSDFAFAVRLAYCADEWNRVIQIGTEALLRGPEEFEILWQLTYALLISKQQDEAWIYFKRMRDLAPQAPQTKEFARAFAKYL